MRDNLEHGWIVNEKEEEEQVYHICDWCGTQIYFGCDYYNVGGDKVCEECIRDCRRTAN